MRSFGAWPAAYYNEHDSDAAEWLRMLADLGAITQGYIDPRGVVEVCPEQVEGYPRCHFFAGIGGWDYALRLAQWPADRPIWTASLPCQPFSQAGKQRGTEDERHLWPIFRELVEQCRPPVVVGEQVSSKAGREWLAAVQTDLERMGYAVGAADLCAAGIGAPHIRQRLFWAAVSESIEHDRNGDVRRGRRESADCCDVERLGHAERQGQQGYVGPSRAGEREPVGRTGADGGLAHNRGQRLEERQERNGRASRSGVEASCGDDLVRCGDVRAPWSDVVYLPCLDNKARPIPNPETQSGVFPLADGIPEDLGRGRLNRFSPRERIEKNLAETSEATHLGTQEGRVMRLRGYGNSIVPQVAAVFISSVMEALGIDPDR